MDGEPGWVPPEVDVKRANSARVYDYLLGGSHNFLADQDLGRSLAATDPSVRAIARANRDFLGRAVRFLAQAGVGQFLDIGSGIPTQGNVHEVAQQGSPGSTVVYVDVDPVAIAHSKALLAGNGNTAVIEADLRHPDQILAHAGTRRLIDFSQPTGLLLVSVLPFISDDADPGRIVATLRDALAPGSYLVLAHATDASRPVVAQATEKVYNGGVSAQARMRSGEEILRFFGGVELVDPGLVYIPLWRPDPVADGSGYTGKFGFLAGGGPNPCPATKPCLPHRPGDHGARPGRGRPPHHGHRDPGWHLNGN